MLLKSFAKINLSLKVKKKLKKEKLFDIESYFCLINIFDDIKVKKTNARKDIVKFEGKFATSVQKKNNSITNTLQILRKKKIISNFYSVSVNKKIPVFAGMGGGTSNAACLTNYLSRNQINKNLLDTISKKIGSDLILFFYKQGILKNLKKIIKVKKRHKINFLIVYPNIKCSTRYVYSKVKKYSPKNQISLNNIRNKRRFLNFFSNKKNDLQSIVEKRYPKIKKLILEIKQNKGCYFSRMTGSGSACYGVFKSDKTAKVALSRIKSKYPKYWLTVAKTI